MTRLSSQPATTSAPRAGRVAAVQSRADGAIAIVVAETGGSGFAITETILSDRDQANEALRVRRVDLVIRLVPATETVCRVLPSPDVTSADRTSVADALALQAESELPASLPWHRRSAGTIRLAGRPATLLTGWVAAGVDGESVAPLSSVPEVWVAEIAALAALGDAVEAGSMIGLADQRMSALSLLALGTKRPVGRVLRIGATSSDWQQSVRALWDETAAAAGAEASLPASEGLLLDMPSTVRLGGGNRDREWINRFGLATGAVALYVDPDAAVSSLVGLTPDEPRRAMPIGHRIVDWLSRPRNAAAVGAACVAVLLFAPWGAAQARYSMLRSEAGSLSELDERLNEADRRMEFYRLLSQKRWPMTKLLADIAGAAPQGVVFETVELAQGEVINIRATAENSDLVTRFRKNLGDTTVFTGVATPTIDASSEGVTFQLQARLSPSGAITASKPIDDFAAKTLAQRLYGDDASGSSAGDWDEDAPSESRSRGNDDRRSGSSSRDRDQPSRSGSRSSERSSAPAAAPVVIPPPLSDAEIEAMDQATAMREWGVRRKASTQIGLEPAVKERLAAEGEKCKARMQAAAAAAGGAK